MPSFLEKQRHLPVTIAIAESCWGLLLPQAGVVIRSPETYPPVSLGMWSHICKSASWVKINVCGHAAKLS